MPDRKCTEEKSSKAWSSWKLYIYECHRFRTFKTSMENNTNDPMMFYVSVLYKENKFYNRTTSSTWQVRLTKILTPFTHASACNNNIFGRPDCPVALTIVSLLIPFHLFLSVNVVASFSFFVNISYMYFLSSYKIPAIWTSKSDFVRKQLFAFVKKLARKTSGEKLPQSTEYKYQLCVCVLLGLVESAECGVRRAENEECGKRGVWKTRSVENVECGKCGVWKMRGIFIMHPVPFTPSSHAPHRNNHNEKTKTFLFDMHWTGTPFTT